MGLLHNVSTICSKTADKEPTTQTSQVSSIILVLGVDLISRPTLPYSYNLTSHMTKSVISFKPEMEPVTGGNPENCRWDYRSDYLREFSGGHFYFTVPLPLGSDSTNSPTIPQGPSHYASFYWHLILGYLQLLEVPTSRGIYLQILCVHIFGFIYSEAFTPNLIFPPEKLGGWWGVNHQEPVSLPRKNHNGRIHLIQQLWNSGVCWRLPTSRGRHAQ